MKFIKKHLSTILLCVAFIVGLSLLAYPTVSDYWNSVYATHTVSSYSSSVADIDDDRYAEIMNAAYEYNETLTKTPLSYVLTADEEAEYKSQLDINAVMGYITIPSIRVELPIYHGTSESVLQVGAGHVAGSSLPVGGVGTHCVLSGHRGLPSAKLFTDLDKLVEGDTFTISVLDEVLTYEVDQILIVEPDDISALAIDPEQDYCTLVTCTPYGINTQRLLVRGHRIDNAAEALRVTADATQIEPVIVAPFAAVPILIVMLVFVLHRPRNKRRKDV
jgi:sortase A